MINSAESGLSNQIMRNGRKPVLKSFDKFKDLEVSWFRARPNACAAGKAEAEDILCKSTDPSLPFAMKNASLISRHIIVAALCPVSRPSLLPDVRTVIPTCLIFAHKRILPRLQEPT
jgi:hypothetical protein